MSRIVALKHSDGTLTDVQILSKAGHFHPDRGDGSEWIEIDGMPSGEGPFKLSGNKAVLDEAAKAIQDAKLKRQKILSLMKQKSELEAAKVAFPGEDFDADLAEVNAQLEGLSD